MASGSRQTNRAQLILEQATTLFAQHGYEGASIRTIARACSITEAAIYRHYDSKAHLFEEVIRTKAAEHDIRAHLAGHAGEGDLGQILHLVARHILEMADGDRDLMRLITHSCFSCSQASTVLFKEVRLPYIEFLQTELEARIAAGEARAVEPFITARCFVGMVMDCAINTEIWERIAGLKLTAEEVITNNVPVFARGLIAG